MKTVIEIAREAGWPDSLIAPVIMAKLAEFAELVRADERARMAEQPAQQEPVAHRDGFWCADLTCKKCYSADFRFKHKNSVVNESLTTPAQRTWVGLTDVERRAVRNSVPYSQFMSAGEYAEHVQKATEFMLLEKNT